MDLALPVLPRGARQKTVPLTRLQVALKCGDDVFYFDVDLPFHAVFVEDGVLGDRLFAQMWAEFPDAQSSSRNFRVNGAMRGGLLREVTTRLAGFNVFVNGAGLSLEHAAFGPDSHGTEMLCVSAKTTNGIVILAQLSLSAEEAMTVVSCCVKTPIEEVVQLFHRTIESILSSSTSTS